MHYCTSLQRIRAECTCSDVVMMGRDEKIIHLNNYIVYNLLSRIPLMQTTTLNRGVMTLDLKYVAKTSLYQERHEFHKSVGHAHKASLFSVLPTQQMFQKHLVNLSLSPGS